MFPHSVDVYESRSTDQRALLAAATARSRYAAAEAAARGTAPVLATVRHIFAAALGRLADLTHDSRDGLRTEEQELAAWGVTWASDPACDELLARQIAAARRGRHAGSPVTHGAPAATRPCTRPGTAPATPQPAVPSHA